MKEILYFCKKFFFMRKKFVKIMWTVLLGLIGIVACLTVLAWNGYIGYMPDMDELQNPVDRYASQVYSADGKLMGTYSAGNQNRYHMDYENISPYLIQALVATEDARFYDHSGIDFIALSRALVKRGVMRQKSAGGGSTITQQLAKQLYSEKARSTFQRLLQKPQEWIIAIKLERNFTKEEIITMYLNQFDFLHNAVGIKNAANTYFNKEPKNLTVEEAATLVGMCKNPSYFNPVRHPERCEERRNIVLQQMEKEGYISHSDYLNYKSIPLKLDFRKVDHNDGYGQYMREYLRKYMMAEKPDPDDYPSWNHNQYVLDSIAWAQDPLYGWCHKNKKADGSDYSIYTDGLRIHTTLDTRMQKYAEQAVWTHMAKTLQPAFNREMAHKRHAPYSNTVTDKKYSQMLTRTIRQSARYRSMKAAGYSEEEINHSFKEKVEMNVFTYYGDVDTLMTPLDSIMYYKRILRAGLVSIDAHSGAIKAYVGGIDFTHFKYDMAMLGRRQVGSTIKPYVYAMGVDNGLTPCDVLPNTSAYPTWHVKGASGGSVTLKQGLARSLNGVSTQLMHRFSYDGSEFMNILEKYGIYLPGIKPTPTICLGSCEISIGEMASGYTAFVNHGIRCAPMLVTRIEDSNGNVIATFEPRVNEVISEDSSYKMLILLQGVVNGGTGSRIHRYGITAQMGGKTGTTNDNADGWFMGVTPSLVTGCWVGGEDREIHFDNMAYGQGASAALPIYALYMQRVYADERLPYTQKEVFDIPEGFVDCDLGFELLDEAGVEDVFE